MQRSATAATLGYLNGHGRSEHPHDLLAHSCLPRGQLVSGATLPWGFERDGEELRLDPPNRLLGRLGASIDLAISVALAGVGVIHIFEGKLAAVSQQWCAGLDS